MAAPAPHRACPLLLACAAPKCRPLPPPGFLASKPAKPAAPAETPTAEQLLQQKALASQGRSEAERRLQEARRELEEAQRELDDAA